MRFNLTVAFSLFMLGAASPAFACSSKTVDLITSVADMAEPPLFRCGQEFNEMLALAKKKDWKGALSAYELHLTRVGKWQAGTPDAEEALKYLRQKANEK